ncbi:DNA gyrase subunit A [Galdieria sulphuraria]|nr:DNA gyrase subunit A [Galdieria sulphuraria]
MPREQPLGWMPCRCIPLSCTKPISFLSVWRSSVRRYTSKKPLEPNGRNSKYLQKAPKEDEKSFPTELGEEVSKSYLEYALSVILGRAIPDARMD